MINDILKGVEEEHMKMGLFTEMWVRTGVSIGDDESHRDLEKGSCYYP